MGFWLKSTVVLAIAVAMAFPFTPTLNDANLIITPNPNGPFDLPILSAPTTQGGILVAFVRALRIPVLGRALLNHIYNDNKFDVVRRFAAGVPNPYPMFEPYTYPTDEVMAQHKAKADAKDAVDWSKSRSHEYTSRYASGKATPTDAIRRTLENIKAVNGELKAFVHFNEAQSMREAEASTARYKAGKPLSALDGVPIAVKTEFAVVGFPNTIGTKFLSEKFPDADHEPIRRLRAAGAIVVGTTNMHEIGIGTTGFNSHYGSARNPHNTSRHTGGSSAGSAAAVAAGLVPIAIGTDGGGSVRIPAALCGVPGLKPTQYRVPEESELAWTVCTGGPIGATMEDVALMYSIIGGGGDHPQPPVHTFGLQNKKLNGVRVGVFSDLNNRATPELKASTARALDKLKAQGATVQEISIPHMVVMSRAHAMVILTEMQAGMDRTGKHFDEFGLDVQVNLLIQSTVDSVDFVAANIARRWFHGVLADVFKQVDVIVTPATGVVAPPVCDDARGDMNLELLEAIYRYMPMANLLGLPGAVAPVGVSTDRMPLSVQVLAGHWNEALAMQVASAAQEVIPTPAVYMDIKKIFGN